MFGQAAIALTGAAFMINAAAATEASMCASHCPPAVFTFNPYTPQYASAIAEPSTHTTYAAPFARYSTLIPHQSYTTWASVAHPSDSADPYGNVAWSKQWSYRSVTAPPITTTVSPTPVPTSELVKPNPLPLVSGDPALAGLKLPANFTWGFAGAAAQVEGAAASEGRGPFAFELFLAESSGTSFVTGDISDLNYYYYKQDIARLAAAGVQTYSFSIAWPRIMPFGVQGSPINQQAIDHYHDLIDTCLEYGMKPVATLTHFDTPLYFFSNTSALGYDHPDFLESFIRYGKLVMAQYADRIPIWVTYNEANADAFLGNHYSAYNILQSHATLAKFYKNTLKGKGQVTIKLATFGGFGVPLNPSDPQDVAAARRWNDFQWGVLSNPLYLGIDIPQSVRDTFPASVPPNFTTADLEFFHGTSDFYSIDPYTSVYVTSPHNSTIESCASDPSNSLYPNCVTTTFIRDTWQIGYEGNPSNVFIAYQHLRELLNYLWTTYKPPAIAITEFGFNGFDEANKTVDAQRENLPQSIYYISFLDEMLKAIHFDCVNVIAAIAWTYVDNWEWGSYLQRYGVQTLDQTTLQRQYKRAIFDYVDWFHLHGA